jgi:hypothetical protein
MEGWRRADVVRAETEGRSTPAPPSTCLSIYLVRKEFRRSE